MVRHKASLLVLGAVAPFVLGKNDNASKSVQDVNQQVCVLRKVLGQSSLPRHLDSAIHCLLVSGAGSALTHFLAGHRARQNLLEVYTKPQTNKNRGCTHDRSTTNGGRNRGLELCIAQGPGVRYAFTTNQVHADLLFSVVS